MKEDKTGPTTKIRSFWYPSSDGGGRKGNVWLLQKYIYEFQCPIKNFYAKMKKENFVILKVKVTFESSNFNLNMQIIFYLIETSLLHLICCTALVCWLTTAFSLLQHHFCAGCCPDSWVLYEMVACSYLMIVNLTMWFRCKPYWKYDEVIFIVNWDYIFLLERITFLNSFSYTHVGWEHPNILSESKRI